MEAIEQDGYPVAAVAAWASNRGEMPEEWDALAREEFVDTYCGEFAEDLDLIPREYAWPASYIDWDAATHDLFSGDYWSQRTGSGTLYVFRSV